MPILYKMNIRFIDKIKSWENKTNNVFVYCRVSTDLQTTESQLFEITNYCEKEKIYPPLENFYTDDGISGFKFSWKKRKIGMIVDKCKKGDTIILPELSRAGRNMHEQNEFLKHCIDNKIILIDIKNNIKYDGSINSQIMGQIINMVCFMERTAISERIKAGMKNAKEKGHLDNRKTRTIKLNNKMEIVKKLLEQDITLKEMSIKLNESQETIYNFIVRNKLSDKYKKGKHKDISKSIHDKKDEIKKMIDEKKSIKNISETLNLNYMSLRQYIKHVL